MSTGEVRLERQGHLAILTIDRPDRRNALDDSMWRSLDRAVSDLESLLPRVVILTGAGDRAFCAGMDLGPENPQIQSLVDAVRTHDPAPVAAMLTPLRALLDRLVSLPVPIIAAINGLAYGGGAEIAARCDLRVLEPSAVLCFSEVRLGLMPDLGGGVALTRLLGPSRAADLILTSRRIEAPEALALGLANRISAPTRSLPEAIALAESILQNGPRAVRGALEIIRRTPDLSQSEALALELDRAITLIASGECAHGIQAFLTRTPPTFPDA